MCSDLESNQRPPDSWVDTQRLSCTGKAPQTILSAYNVQSPARHWDRCRWIAYSPWFQDTWIHPGRWYRNIGNCIQVRAGWIVWVETRSIREGWGLSHKRCIWRINKVFFLERNAKEGGHSDGNEEAWTKAWNQELSSASSMEYRLVLSGKAHWS